MTSTSLPWEDAAAVGSRVTTWRDPIADLQCQLINLANAINRMHYETASRLASMVRRLMAAAEGHVSGLPADVERAIAAARLSALSCTAERVLLVAPRARPDAREPSQVTASIERCWIRQRVRNGPLLLAYDRGTLVCGTAQA